MEKKIKTLETAPNEYNGAKYCRICGFDVDSDFFDDENDKCFKHSEFFRNLEYGTGDLWGSFVGNQSLYDFFESDLEKMTFFESDERDKLIENAIRDYVTLDHEFFTEMSEDELEIIIAAMINYVNGRIDEVLFERNEPELRSNLTENEFNVVSKRVYGEKLNDAERQAIQRIRKKREKTLNLKSRIKFFEKFTI